MDPFQDTNGGIWKSLDRYKAEQKEKLFSHATGNLDADAKAVDENDAAEEQKAAEAAANNPNPSPSAAPDAKTAATAVPVFAEPSRPIIRPVLPGMAAEFSLPVDTTVDDIKPLARVTNIETEPDLQLPKDNWVEASQAVRLQGDESGKNRRAITVRLSVLPSLRLPHKKPAATVALAKPVPPPAPPPAPVDHAACAAVDAYRKRELEAIQSDRQTLVALQSAIKDLGLNKQLDFIAGADSKIDTPHDAGGMSTPATP